MRAVGAARSLERAKILTELKEVEMPLLPKHVATIPIFLVCRDQVESLGRLVQWLEVSGHERLILVDNASSYHGLLDYYAKTPHKVVRLNQNLGARASIWESGVLQKYAKSGYFAVSDSDVVPDENCPSDLLAFLLWVLERYPEYFKAGPGLRVDDIPNHYQHAAAVRDWEGQFWRRPLQKGLYRANIDTTFALYRPGSFTFSLGPSIRTGSPYLARHLPWYVDSESPSEEYIYYRAHSERALSHWTKLPPDHVSDSNKLRPAPLKDRIRWSLHARLKVKRDRTVPKKYPGIG